MDEDASSSSARFAPAIPDEIPRPTSDGGGESRTSGLSNQTAPDPVLAAGLDRVTSSTTDFQTTPITLNPEQIGQRKISACVAL